MHDRINTVLFDLGNVLLEFDRSPAYDAVCAGLDIGRPKLIDLLEKKETRVKYETGLMSTGEFVSAVLELCGENAPPTPEVRTEIFKKCYTDAFTGNRDVIAIAEKLKTDGTEIFLASNTSELDYSYVEAEFPAVTRLFEGKTFLSYEQHVFKPDDAYFRRFLEVTNKKCGECLFIDDIAANVESARRTGLTAVRFENPAQLVRDLLRFGLNVRT